LGSFLKDSKKPIIFDELFPDMKENTIYKFSDALMCNYYIWLLPDTDERTAFVVGPYLKTDISSVQIMENAESVNLDPRKIKSLNYYLGNVPLILDENAIFAVIGSFAERIWGSSDAYNLVDISNEQIPVFNTFNLKTTVNEAEDSTAFNMRLMEQRYSYENELMNAVSQGLTHKAELLLTNFSEISFEKRAADPLRNIKNYFIIMNTLLRKAAENGGVHPIYIDSISSSYAKRIEELSSIDGTGKFMVEIFRAYSNLVKNHSISKFSPAVQKTIVTVDSDLTADLSLNALSAHNNVSAGYLSTLFKNDTGQTLTEFVNRRRVKMAKKLLKTTNLQVQTIAQHCGILDVQYFTKLFKKYEGKTPKEYRASL
ncbi:MAG: helix-turn-helix domain-containing protein, partial [Clostridia bacterium]|nr:helix-turn-helix domain-containing protein [Clostridia bacterium]